MFLRGVFGVNNVERIVFGSAGEINAQIKIVSQKVRALGFLIEGQIGIPRIGGIHI